MKIIIDEPACTVGTVDESLWMLIHDPADWPTITGVLASHGILDGTMRQVAWWEDGAELWELT